MGVGSGGGDRGDGRLQYVDEGPGVEVRGRGHTNMDNDSGEGGSGPVETTTQV